MGPSANRITLLRDADGDGVADFRATFLEGLDRPFGMALVGDKFYVGATDGVYVFAYRVGQTHLQRAAEGKFWACPPAATTTTGHVTWCSALTARVDSTSPSAPRAMSANTGWRKKSGARASSRSTSTVNTSACTRRACAILLGWIGSRTAASCGLPSTSATSWAMSSCRTT